MFWLKRYNINPLKDEELKIIEAYFAQIVEFPLEKERLAWAPDILKKLDEKLECITIKHRL